MEGTIEVKEKRPQKRWTIIQINVIKATKLAATKDKLKPALHANVEKIHCKLQNKGKMDEMKPSSSGSSSSSISSSSNRLNESNNVVEVLLKKVHFKEKNK
jgi:hypothetical protein